MTQRKSAAFEGTDTVLLLSRYIEGHLCALQVPLES
jgi:hypothetical protein